MYSYGKSLDFCISNTELKICFQSKYSHPLPLVVTKINTGPFQVLSVAFKSISSTNGHHAHLTTDTMCLNSDHMLLNALGTFLVASIR